MTCLLGAAGASAAPVIGSLRSTLGLVTDNQWGNDDGLEILWSVTQNPDQSWHYSYAFSDLSQRDLRPGVSHVILSLAPNVKPEHLSSLSPSIDAVEFGTFGPHPSNPGFPAGFTIQGVKFDLRDDQASLAFDAPFAPTWGNVYAKGGGASFAYNTGLTNPGIHIPVPGHSTNAPIPEPAGLATLAITGALLARRRRRC